MVDMNILESIGQFIYQLEPVNNIIQGILLIAQGVSFIVFLPLKMLGISLVPIITNLIYLAIIFYIAYRLTDSKKWGFAILLVMIVVGAIGGV